MHSDFINAIIFCINMCLCYNKSVLNWTFCQLLLCLKKTPIAQNWWAAVGSLSSNFKEEDTNSKKKLKPMLVQRESQDPLHHYQNSYWESMKMWEPKEENGKPAE